MSKNRRRNRGVRRRSEPNIPAPIASEPVATEPVGAATKLKYLLILLVASALFVLVSGLVAMLLRGGL